VADRGMFSDRHLAALEASGFSHVLAFRNRTDEEAERAVRLACQRGLPIPRGPRPPEPPRGRARAEYRFVEVRLKPGHRHLVVHSPVRARRDFEVRRRRLKRSRERLIRPRAQAAKRRLGPKRIIEQATRILTRYKTIRYFSYVADKGVFIFWLRRDVYRKQRRHDGFFVLKTNDLGLSLEAILDAYLQLQEIERCFRRIKARLKLRPIDGDRGNSPGSITEIPQVSSPVGQTW
jgi:hypothetical protein